MALTGPAANPYKIVAPSRDYNGFTMGVQFKNGIGYTYDKRTADRLTWDFHYESQPLRPGEKIDPVAARLEADTAHKMLQAGVISRQQLNAGMLAKGPWASFAEPHLAKLEDALDRHEAAVAGQDVAWLKGRVREIVELVPLRG